MEELNINNICETLVHETLDIYQTLDVCFWQWLKHYKPDIN
jgi:hypothetical protein